MVELKVLGKMVLETALLRNERPNEVQNEFSSIDERGPGDLVLQNSRYKTRARASEQTSIVLTNERGDEFVGRAKGALGKTTEIVLNNGRSISGAIESVRTIGREDLTTSERARDEYILLALRGERTTQESPFIEYLWFSPPKMEIQAPSLYTISMSPSIASSLNESQKGVIKAMLDDSVPLVIAHGPPGTGKTSTITAAVKTWDESNIPVWVVAQSNVAVKNIAESLLKRQVNFKLIVSPDFYVEWHEHIYEEIQQHLLLTDELSADPGATERLINGCQVVLCTLSMLSSYLLQDRRVFQIVPVEVLVVDEASQIEIGEYMVSATKHRAA
ncbi:hypothetical protein HWV62_39321 [Athelia sp. TMB]|nr:hypothetical protein HWV62_39321 [Athelia sp. TMB]